MQYYYIINNQQMGPVDESQLPQLGVTAATPVWHEGMPQWTPAGQVPQLAHLFGQFPPQFQQPTPGYQQPAYGQQPSGAMPDNYLVWGILTTLFCCMPLGIVSIVKSSKVSSLWAMGQYEESLRASKEAKKWAIWSAVSAAILWVFYFIFYVLIIGLSVAAGNY